MNGALKLWNGIPRCYYEELEIKKNKQIKKLKLELVNLTTVLELNRTHILELELALKATK